jgi:hypothetical protein
MRAHITDKESLQSITPVQILAYIRSRGAKKTDDFCGKAAIFQYGEAELLIPLEMHYADYALRVADILSILEKTEDRSQLLIAEDITRSSFDVIRVRNVSEDTRQGTLSLLRSVEFVESARDMLSAAACFAATRKSSYPGRRPQDADRFMESVRFGKTEHGSFILQLLAPVTPELYTQEALLKDPYEEEPYERRVVPTLQSGLDALKDAAKNSEMDPDASHFLNAVSKGVTSNLCEAIIGMYESLKPQYIEVGITYSANRRKPRPLARISVDSGHIPIIKEAAACIKASGPESEEGQLVRGYVVRLASEPPMETGEIAIRDLMTPTPRLLRVGLPQKDYQKALDAHKNKQIVEISGTITKSGHSSRLVPDTSLTIVEAPADEQLSV